MNRRKSTAILAAVTLVTLATLTISLPVDAGGGRGKSSAHSGHQAHHGVAILNRNSRNLPNGVAIFNRRPPASPTHGAKSVKHAPRKRHGMHRSSKSEPGAAGKSRRGRVAMKSSDHDFSRDRKKRRGDRRHSSQGKKKHERHAKKRIVYGSTVYVAVPVDDLYYAEETDEESCRSLIERGYDLSGRRVLVEWTLCFDEQGEAYLPENGRRIVARY